MVNFSILDDIVTDKQDKPSNLDIIYFLFWEKGIDYNQINKLPIPYIFAMLNTLNWSKKEEEKAYKKVKKR